MSKIKQMPHVTVGQVLALRDAAVKLEQERNELAAQVERLRSALKLINDWDSHDIGLAVNQGSNGVRDFYRNIANAAHEQAPAALATLKAEWQAEALSNMANYLLKIREENQSSQIDHVVIALERIARQRTQERDQ